MAKQPKNWTHKVRPVRIAEMRVPTAGVMQRRYSQSQAEEYAANFDPNKIGIPAVNFRAGIYWIVDGQHRVEAIKLYFAPSDPGSIDCNVYVDLSDSEMAELFIGLNTRRSVNRFDLFQVACTAERTRETEIRRIVESNGLKIKQEKAPDAVGAVSSLCKIFDRSGSTVLGQTLRTLRDGLSGDPMAFDGYLLVGTANVFNRFNGKTNERHLVKALTEVRQGAQAILRRAEAQRDRTGNNKVQCVSAAIVDIYNKSVGPRAKDRLPSWWKEAES
jgi:hypothetical protein